MTALIRPSPVWRGVGGEVNQRSSLMFDQLNTVPTNTQELLGQNDQLRNGITRLNMALVLIAAHAERGLCESADPAATLRKVLELAEQAQLQ